jgi:pimeloyl-ACP methyl ester carboxylesterase
MVDVGGYRLHVKCMGDGSPTVILESGLPGAVPVWGWVQPEVARLTRVCAYDRAGDGWSELGPEPRNATRIAAELHTLLTNAGIQGPVVLVGHSFGGIFVRVFASRYPEQVLGMVLIDALHPDQWTRTPVAGKFYNKAMTSVTPLLARLGVVRFIFSFIMNPDPNLPTKQQAELRAILSGTRVWESDRAVYQTLDETMAEARTVSSLGSVPLMVLTATEHGDSLDGELLHQQLQTELAALSSNSRHQIVQGATHNSLIDDREMSLITVDAIRQVLDQAGGVSRSNTQTY